MNNMNDPITRQQSADGSASPEASGEADISVRSPKSKTPKRLSQVLNDLSSDQSRERIALSDLLETLRLRAFGPLLLVFSFPNIIPAPPGTSAILGLPLIFLAFQMVIGSKPWFPPFIARRSVSRVDFARIMSAALPRLSRAERMLKPRLALLSSPIAEKVLGVFCLSLALVLVLPIPLGNMAPSFAIAIIGLGLVERDGLWILFGIAAGFAAMFIVSGVVWAMARTAYFLITSTLA
jgi:hypothetical protein